MPLAALRNEDKSISIKSFLMSWYNELKTLAHRLEPRELHTFVALRGEFHSDLSSLDEDALAHHAQEEGIAVSDGQDISLALMQKFDSLHASDIEAQTLINFSSHEGTANNIVLERLRKSYDNTLTTCRIVLAFGRR